MTLPTKLMSGNYSDDAYSETHFYQLIFYYKVGCKINKLSFRNYSTNSHDLSFNLFVIHKSGPLRPS
jgi:hypothetical protein